MNTHLFDGKITFRTELSLPAPELRYPLFQSFRAAIHHPLLDLVVHDLVKYPRTDRRNYDPTNDLYLDDILYLCCHIFIKLPDSVRPDYMLLLREQLQDLATGLCAQGRIYRFLQMVTAFHEYV